MGRRDRSRRRHEHHHGHHPPHRQPPARDDRLTARQVAMERHRLFVEEFALIFGPEWTKTLWRAVERRMTDSAA